MPQIPKDLPDVSDLSPGAISLLALAAGAYDDRTKQRRNDVLDGGVLRRLFANAGTLPEACGKARGGDDNDLRARIGNRQASTLFDMFVCFHEQIRQEAAEASKKEFDGDLRMTGFDHSAYLAHYQAFSILLEIEDGVGPDYRGAVDAIAELDPREIQWEILANYFGNILQDYFEAASIRKKQPGLPADTEQNLREEDGTTAADIIFGLLPDGAGLVDWSDLRPKVGLFLFAVSEAEKGQHAARNR